MSNNHSGNIQNQIMQEEHDGQLNAKRSSLVSAATIYAVVNTSASSQGNVTLNPSPNFIGIVTVANPGGANSGNVTLNPSPNFIGIVTVANPGSFTGNVTLDDGSLTGIVGNVTLSDSKGFIGLTTTTLGASPAFVGIVTVANPSAFTGNVTLSDSKTFIGLTTSTLGASPAFIGIVTIANPSSFTGNVTLDDGSLTGIVGNVTLSDSKGFIGLTTSVVASIVTVSAKVTETHGPGYEDNVTGRAVVELRYTPTNLTSITTLSIDPTPGFLHGIWVGAISCPSTILYNNTVPSGTILTRIPCGMPVGFYQFNGEYSVGLTVDSVAGGGGVNPFFTFLWR